MIIFKRKICVIAWTRTTDLQCHSGHRGPNWLRRQYGELEIYSSNPGYDTNFSLKNHILIFQCLIQYNNNIRSIIQYNIYSFIHSFIHSIYLSFIDPFTWLTPPGPYRATAYRERELTLDHIHNFWPRNDMEGLPRWGIRSMPGPPSRQHNINDDTAITYPFILTRWISKDDYGSQMIFGDLLGLKLLDIYLTGEEKPRKSLTQETCPDRWSTPGPLCNRRACYRLLHSGGL